MNMSSGSLIEFLQDIQNLEGFKKEFLFELKEGKKFVSVYYKCFPFPREIFSVFFTEKEELLKYKGFLKKNGNYQLVISEVHWIPSGGELKPVTGEKRFIECQLIDIRKDFIKIKIIL